MNDAVLTLKSLTNGEIVAGGEFTIAGGVASPYVVRFRLPDQCCDSLDFNADGLFPDNLDLTDFLSVFGGGNCNGQAPNDPPCNTDIDFNNDGLFPDNEDIISLFRVFGGGPC